MMNTTYPYWAPKSVLQLMSESKASGNEIITKLVTDIRMRSVWKKIVSLDTPDSEYWSLNEIDSEYAFMSSREAHEIRFLNFVLSAITPKPHDTYTGPERNEAIQKAIGHINSLRGLLRGIVGKEISIFELMSDEEVIKTVEIINPDIASHKDIEEEVFRASLQTMGTDSESLINTGRESCEDTELDRAMTAVSETLTNAAIENFKDAQAERARAFMQMYTLFVDDGVTTLLDRLASRIEQETDSVAMLKQHDANQNSQIFIRKLTRSLYQAYGTPMRDVVADTASVVFDETINSDRVEKLTPPSFYKKTDKMGGYNLA